jgi:hypothetical protein
VSTILACIVRAGQCGEARIATSAKGDEEVNRVIVHAAVAGVALTCLIAPLATADEKDVNQLEELGFVKLFDGETLSGWKAVDSPESWTAQPDGTIQGKGKVSHLFSPKEYTDFEYRAEIKINKGGNSGMYFRTQMGPGFPKGYEAQINSSHRDPQRSGSLYGIVKILDKLTDDDTWFTQHVICKGNHIVIKVNGKTVVDHADEEKRFSKGHFAFQQHDPDSVVHLRNVMVKDLSSND